MTIVQQDSTVGAMRQKVRRLTSSSSEQQLSTETIDQALNTFVLQDFPYAIKLDQMRNVYTFFTTPNVDRYPLNVNYNQGMRAPVYFEGIKGMYFKDRDQFFNMWPRWPTLNTFSTETLSGAITNITQADPAVITANNTLLAGSSVYITEVEGMTEINNDFYTVISATSTSITIDLDTSGFAAYTTGGIYQSVSQSLSGTIQNTPFLGLNFVLGGTEFGGGNIVVTDDGNGNLLYVTQNASVPVPTVPTVLPGMVNNNLSSTVNYNLQQYQTYPGDQINSIVGTVNYVTGVFNINLSLVNITPAIGSTYSIWVSQYAAGRPYTMLFWNNEFTIRPVPDRTYKVEIETYLTPIQFLESTDIPILSQWWQYIAYGASIEILRERNDFDGVNALMEGFKRQEALVLERQGVEEIGQRNATLFSSSIPQQGWNQGFGWPY